MGVPLRVLAKAGTHPPLPHRPWYKRCENVYYGTKEKPNDRTRPTAESHSRDQSEARLLDRPPEDSLMLTEEVGEIASELKPLWSNNYGDFDPARLQDEIADAFVLLSALATRFDIDIETAVTKKFFQKDSLRPWKSAPSTSP